MNFVGNNRKEVLIENPYDVVIGPVTNDSTLPVIDDYMDGNYDKEEAVKTVISQYEMWTDTGSDYFEVHVAKSVDHNLGMIAEDGITYKT